MTILEFKRWLEHNGLFDNTYSIKRLDGLGVYKINRLANGSIQISYTETSD
jgi:hypothetical protein